MKSTTFAPLPPEAGIYQSFNQDKTVEWNEIQAKLVLMDGAERETALAMGDIFLTVEERFGKAHVKTMAIKSGIDVTVASQRAWVSRRIPQGDPLRNEPGLPYSHLRALATVPAQERMDWAERALAGDWTSKRLKAEIDGAGVAEESAARETATCVQCGDAIPEEAPASERVVRFSLIGKRGVCCRPRCIAEYFFEWDAEEVEDTTPGAPTGSAPAPFPTNDAEPAAA